MAQNLSGKDFEKDDQSLDGFDFKFGRDRLGVLVASFFFLGLFLLAIGAGLFFFKNQSSDEIQIISAGKGTEQGLAVIHVDGAVVKPGVYRLREDARVETAIAAAGGLASDADQSRINLAAKVTDGQKIYIPKIGESVSSSIDGSVSRLININVATQAELEELPGIGPITAQKIIASRPYSGVGDLLTKKVVNRSVFEKIKDKITVY